MTADAAWKLFYPELVAVTVDNWTDEDYEDEPTRQQCAVDIAAGNITPDVLDEIESCQGRCWCDKGQMKTALLTLLAAHNRLDKFDPNATYSRRPRTLVLLGERWIIG